MWAPFSSFILVIQLGLTKLDAITIGCDNCKSWTDGCNSCGCSYESWNNKTTQLSYCTEMYCSPYGSEECYSCVGSSIDLTQITFNTNANDEIDSILSNFQWNMPVDACFTHQTMESTFSYKFICDNDISLQYYDNNAACSSSSLQTFAISEIDMNDTNCDGYESCLIKTKVELTEYGNNDDCGSGDYYLGIAFTPAACNNFNDSYWYYVSCNDENDDKMDITVYDNKYCSYSWNMQDVNLTLQQIIMNQYSDYLTDINMTICQDNIKVTSCVDSFSHSRQAFGINTILNVALIGLSTIAIVFA